MAECPAPEMCIQGPDPHIWASGYCERIDEGWNTDVASSSAHLSPSADVPACRDEDPAQPATLAACYPDPPEYAHPEEPGDGV